MPKYVERLEELQVDQIWEELEGDRPCKDPTVWSASTLAVAWDCGERYRLTFQERAKPERRKPTLIRGTAVHAVANELHRTGKWDDWGDIYDEKWRAACAEEPDIPWDFGKGNDEDVLDEIRVDGRIIAGNYARLNRNARVIATEVPFRMLLEHPRTGTRRRMAGTVDQIREMDDAPMRNQDPGIWIPGGVDHLKITDLKTHIATPDEYMLRQDPQLTSYGKALRDGVFILPDGEIASFGCLPERLEWYALYRLLPYKRKTNGIPAGELRGDPVIEAPRTALDYEAWMMDVLRLIQAIRMKLLTKHVSQFTCPMCNFRDACLTGQYLRYDDAAGFEDMTRF